jgi:hypothetical protein
MSIVDYYMHELLLSAETLLVPKLMELLESFNPSQEFEFVSRTVLTQLLKQPVDKALITFRDKSHIPFIYNCHIQEGLLETNLKVLLRLNRSWKDGVLLENS